MKEKVLIFKCFYETSNVCIKYILIFRYHDIGDPEDERLDDARDLLQRCLPLPALSPLRGGRRVITRLRHHRGRECGVDPPVSLQ